MVSDSTTAVALPLLRHPDLQAPIAWRDGQHISAQHFLADSAALAATLPDRRYQFNLCKDRYHFMVAFAAAMLRGQVVLLPSGRAPRELQQIAAQRGSCYCLGDDDSCPGSIDSVRYHVEAQGNEAAREVPLIPADQCVLELFTSGSTGTPTAHRKHWGEMVQGALLTGGRLGLAALGQAAILATVPPQHMYGIETSIMLPLQWGLAIDPGQPLFAADIAQRLAGLPEPRLLVTTPIHLRSCIAEGAPMPRPQFILSATAPLSAELARATESAFNAPVWEIYGCTEAGAIATRRPAQQLRWQPLDGIRLQSSDTHVVVRAGHLQGPLRLSDRIRLDNGSFELLGRSSDLLKVGGKRASLGDLNNKLLAIEGVEDGVFYMPDAVADSAQRLCAFVVAPTLKRQVLLQALRPLIDPAFMPRPLHFVNSLPRDATGKLARNRLNALYARCCANGSVSQECSRAGL